MIVYARSISSFYLYSIIRSSSSTSTSSSSPGGDIVHFAPSGSVTLCPALPWQHAYPGELLQLYGFGSLTPPYSRRQTCALDALPLSFFDKAPVAMQSAPLDVSSKKLLIYRYIAQVRPFKRMICTIRSVLAQTNSWENNEDYIWLTYSRILAEKSSHEHWCHWEWQPSFQTLWRDRSSWYCCASWSGNVRWGNEEIE